MPFGPLLLKISGFFLPAFNYNHGFKKAKNEKNFYTVDYFLFFHNRENCEAKNNVNVYLMLMMVILCP